MRLLIAAALLTLVVGTVAVPGVAARSVAARAAVGPTQTVGAAAVATARFHKLKVAKARGYGRPPAPAPLHRCISSLDDTGAMGVHFIKGALLDDTVDARHPEVLVYARNAHGRLKLVALEYVVFQADWFASHSAGTTPMLFGQMFMATPDDNRYEIPAFFSLHVWLWKNNPAGLFEPFNTRVSCGSSSPTASAGATAVGGALGDLAAAPRLAAARFTCSIARRATVA